MYEIQGLATAPAAQGRGYGKALVKTITDMVRPSLQSWVRDLLNSLLQADAEGRDVWVITSDARPFYELQEFSVVRTAFIGANNPAWDRAPVVVSIVSTASA